MRKIIPYLQLTLSIVFGLLLFRLNLLPLLYVAIITSILVVLSTIFILMMHQKQKNKKKPITVNIISTLLSLILMYGSLGVYRGTSFINDIVLGNTKKISIVAFVPESSEIQDLTGLGGKNLGFTEQIDGEFILSSINSIDEKLSTPTNRIRLSNYNEVMNSLNSKQSEVILITTSQFGYLDAIDPNFIDGLREIGRFDYKVKINDISKDVKVTKESFNIYLSGVDTREGGPGDNSLSDVNIILTVNPVTKTILQTNIPRDFFIPSPCMDNQLDKLTHAGMYGVDCSIQSLESLFNIDINFYIRFNFDGFARIVDAVGGVNVHSDYEFSIYNHTNGNGMIYVGNNFLDGADALSFVRERKQVPGGDRTRGVHQQRVIQAVLKSAMSPSIIMNYESFLSSVSGALETNFESSQISSLIRLQINNPSGWQMLSNSVNGSDGQDYPASFPGGITYVMWPNEESVAAGIQMIQQVMSGELTGQ